MTPTVNVQSAASNTGLNSTVGGNMTTDYQSAYGTETSYVGGSGEAFGIAGSNLTNTIGSSINYTINTEDPAVTGALSSIAGEQSAALGTALLQLGAANGANPNLVPDDQKGNPVPVSKSASFSPVLILVLLAVVVILGRGA